MEMGDSEEKNRDAQLLLLDREIARLKQKRNELSPVSVLPPELLATVFRLLVYDQPSWSRQGFTDLVRLTHVSAHWRAVALEQATFWSHIDSYFGPQWLGRFVARSRNAPVSVLLDNDFNTPPATTAEILPQIASLLAQTSRLVSVTLRADPATVGSLLDAFTSPAPRLTRLSIVIVPYRGDDLEAGIVLDQSLSQLEAPALRDIALCDCILSSTHHLYQNVTSLDITVDDLDVSFTPRELYYSLNVVAARLESLTLWFAMGLDHDAELDLAPVTFPKLSSLSLGRTSDVIVNYLPFLSLPSSTSVSLMCAWADYDEIEVMCSALSTNWSSLPDLPMIEKLSATNNSDEFFVHGWRSRIKTQDQDKILDLASGADTRTMDDDDPGYDTRIIHTILGCLPLRNLLDLELTCMFHTPSAMHDILSNLPLLQSIRLCEYLEQLKALLTFLLEDPFEMPSDNFDSTPPDTTTIRLPSLQDITFTKILKIKASLKRLSTALQMRRPFGDCVRKVVFKRCGTIPPDTLIQLKDSGGLEDVVYSPN
ncbi:hypothetical protein BKA70DRAFT_1256671 [Coprinopsis sp. MPI-PUGE-AT-0042]|nr:hypothetical protein BKA70DRAFT_1256671 [Coprinopsis sp. MPI-PUGE-AT-0042]